jgi:hypothetical protein
MESYYAESPSDHKRTISLNLADLKSDTENIHNPNLHRSGINSELSSSIITNPEDFLRKSIRDISKQESNYQQNFSVLLSKSKGTKYEPLLRKLMNMECVEVSYSPHKSAEVPLHRSSEKNSSKNEPTHISVPKRSTYEQQQALKYLAQPVARKIWQVKPINLSLLHPPKYVMPGIPVQRLCDY